MVLLADLTAKGKAGDVGEHHVQDSQIQGDGAHHLQRGGAAAAFVDGKALALEIDLHQVGDLRFIIHHQDMGLHRHSPFSEMVPTLYPSVGRQVKKRGET